MITEDPEILLRAGSLCKTLHQHVRAQRKTTEYVNLAPATLVAESENALLSRPEAASRRTNMSFRAILCWVRPRRRAGAPPGLQPTYPLSYLMRHVLALSKGQTLVLGKGAPALPGRQHPGLRMRASRRPPRWARPWRRTGAPALFQPRTRPLPHPGGRQRHTAGALRGWLRPRQAAKPRAQTLTQTLSLSLSDARDDWPRARRLVEPRAPLTLCLTLTLAAVTPAGAGPPCGPRRGARRWRMRPPSPAGARRLCWDRRGSHKNLRRGECQGHWHGQATCESTQVHAPCARGAHTSTRMICPTGRQGCQPQL